MEEIIDLTVTPPPPPSPLIENKKSEKSSILSLKTTSTDEIFNYEFNLSKLEFSVSNKCEEYEKILNEYKKNQEKSNFPYKPEDHQAAQIERRLSRLSLLENKEENIEIQDKLNIENQKISIKRKNNADETQLINKKKKPIKSKKDNTKLKENDKESKASNNKEVVVSKRGASKSIHVNLNIMVAQSRIGAEIMREFHIANSNKRIPLYNFSIIQDNTLYTEQCITWHRMYPDKIEEKPPIPLILIIYEIKDLIQNNIQDIINNLIKKIYNEFSNKTLYILINDTNQLFKAKKRKSKNSIEDITRYLNKLLLEQGIFFKICNYLDSSTDFIKRITRSLGKFYYHKRKTNLQIFSKLFSNENSELKDVSKEESKAASWKNMLHTIPGVGPKDSNVVIGSHVKNFAKLMKIYDDKMIREVDKESYFENLRLDNGKRVGLEVSRKIYNMMTLDDPNAKIPIYKHFDSE